MKFRTLIRRSLRFHWRSHLGVVMGAALGSAALIGALIVGDSVKGSLRERALERVGNTIAALSASDRLVLETSIRQMEPVPAALVAPALLLPASAARTDGQARVNQVHLLGVDQRFWRLAPSRPAFAEVLPGQVVLNRALARGLGISGTGGEVLLRTRSPSALALDSALSAREAGMVVLRLKVQAMVDDAQAGAFGLRPNATPPANAFVNLAELAGRIECPGRVNLVLAGSLARARTDCDGFVEMANADLARVFSLADAEARWESLAHDEMLELRSPRVFLDPPLVRSALAADTNAQALLTYLANLITVGTNATPYSMVTAAGAPWTPPDLRDDEIVLNQWLAEDLSARPGDVVTLVYFDPESGARLTERTNTFRVHSIAPMRMPWADRTLMPQFPGIEKAETTAEWDTAFPLVHKIRPQDDDYWTEWRGTPKAFITLAAGQKMWANRFGNLTAIRFPIPTNNVAAEVTRLDSAGAPGSSSDLDIRTRKAGEDAGAPTNSVSSTTALPPNPVVGQASCLSGGTAKLALDSHPMDASPDRRDACPTTASVLRFGGSKRELSVGKILTPALSPGERENRPPSPEKTETGDSSTASQPSKSAQSLSPPPGGEGQGEGERQTSRVETFRAALEKKILATLKPEELGLRFEPVREQALKAAEQSQDFGGLFIGFSLFVIVAALLLMALLFQFSLEQRTGEVGTLLALGFTPKQVRRLFLREGAVLALLGGILGTVGGIGYARAMLHGLTTLWSEAVGGSALKFFVTPGTLVIGLFASTFVAMFTLWLALRKQARQPARVLLTGALECGDSSPLSQNATSASDSFGPVQPTFLAKRGPVRALQSGLPLALALGLVAWAITTGNTTNAGAFFGAGALVLIAGLGFLNARLARRPPPSSTLNPPSSQTLALRGLARRRSRSVATAAMLASGTFLIVSIGVFRLDANRDATQRTSGTGGFALIGESTMPMVADLNTRAGREAFALDEADFADVNFVQFRVRAGDEASCLNLNRAQKPRLLGVKPEALEDRFTFNKGAAWPSLRSRRREEAPSEESAIRNRQSAINQSLLTSAATNEVAAIGDANSIQWAMGKKVGDTLDYVDERGQPFKVRIVGAVANSILQGQLIIDEAEFVKRFPGESGYKYFLIDAPTNRAADVSAKLSRALQDAGLELTPAPQRLAQFNAVQNTYLGTFQILGGLGLLLGSAGLGIVVLRNVLERRGELAVLLAVGWRRGAVNQLVLREHLALLGLGLAVGLGAAVVAVLPSALTPGAEFPWLTLSLTLTAVLANGVLWTWLAARAALRGDLLAALRNE